MSDQTSTAMANSEKAGRFQMSVILEDMSEDATSRWSRRSEWLARWLLNEWSRAQGKRGPDGQSSPERDSSIVNMGACVGQEVGR